jgi:NADH dehydrogenase
MGVEVGTGTRVLGVDERGVDVPGGRIACRTAIWAAGVSASPLLATLGVPLDKAGRALVEPDLSLPGHPEIFVIGDAAAVRLLDGEGADADARWVPGLAPAAIQMGQLTAENLRRRLAGEPTRPFRYRDKGQLATLGRSAAVAQIGRLRFTGYFAWLVWAVVHIAWLIGFRNRFVVLFEWAWLYFTQQRSARVIIETGRDAERASRGA